jgi:NitT/TauT family transport system permease protein
MRALQGLRNGVVLVLVLLLLWQALYWWVGDVALRSPWETIRYSVTLVRSSMFLPNLEATAQAFAVALALSIGFGLAIGFSLGISPAAHRVFEPMLVASYAIPKITLYPILLLMFGLGMAAKVAFGVIHGVIPIALFTTSAVQHIRPAFLKAGRTMGLTRGEITRRILLPAAMPEIFSGLRIGFSLTLIGVLLGEMFASQRGIGFLLMNAIGLNNIDLIMALTFVLTLFAGAAGVLLLALGRRVH